MAKAFAIDLESSTSSTGALLLKGRREVNKVKSHMQKTSTNDSICSYYFSLIEEGYILD